MSLSAMVEIPRLQTKRKFVMPALRLLRINSGGHPGDGQRPSYRWKTVSRLRGWGMDPGFHRGDDNAGMTE